MLLQLIITHYKESKDIVFRMLDSINLQQLINFNDIEVILINDGDYVTFTHEELASKNYKFNISYSIKKWEGISAARQFGCNEATADYIMYCDCDDLFFRADALCTIFRYLDNKNDLIICDYLHDNHINNSINLQTLHVSDNLFDPCMLHGHIIRRKFITDNNITWPLSITSWHEDYFYCNLLVAHKPITYRLNETLYWWKYNVGSVSDIPKDQLAVKEIDRIEAIDLLIDKLNSANIDFKSWLLRALFIMYTNENIKDETASKKINNLKILFKNKYYNDIVTLSINDIEEFFKLFDKNLIIRLSLIIGSFTQWINNYMNY